MPSVADTIGVHITGAFSKKKRVAERSTEAGTRQKMMDEERMRHACAQWIQQTWRNRHPPPPPTAAKYALRALATCAVCSDECVKLVRCARGHACCMGCATAARDPRCPVCREWRPLTPDAGVRCAIEACRVSLRCSTCGKMSSAATCEHHRAWCPAHEFVCPHASCMKCTSAAGMAAHALTHANTVRLSASSDGGYDVLVVLPLVAIRSPEPIVVVCASLATVVIEPSIVRTDDAMPIVMISMRAYYASDSTPGLKARMRQLDAEDLTEWTEEHRTGAVAPVLASHETYTHAISVPMSPRSHIGVSPLVAARVRNIVIAIPPGRKVADMLPSLQDIGLRRMGASYSPGLPAVLAHVHLLPKKISISSIVPS